MTNFEARYHPELFFQLRAAMTEGGLDALAAVIERLALQCIHGGPAEAVIITTQLFGVVPQSKRFLLAGMLTGAIIRLQDEVRPRVEGASS